MTDPFNIVKEELKKSVNKTKSLVESYNVLSNDASKDTKNKLLTDIRTNLKSINWDTQDLEETINIASKNPAKYNLTNNDIENRRNFIKQTRDFVQVTKKFYAIELDDSNLAASTKSNKPSTTQSINIRIPDVISNSSNKGYFKLEDKDDSDDELDTRRTNNNRFNATTGGESLQLQQENLFKEQDKNLDLISNRVSNLKNISQTMQNELEDQAFLLDDLGREMDTADSRMGSVMKKLTKVLHMSSDKRQWTLIGVLIGAIIFVFLLLVVL